jgi:hypothetical protein
VNVKELQRQSFQKVGAFRPDDARLIVFDPLAGAARHSNVVYAYEVDENVCYFGETSGCAVARNATVASDTRRKVENGLPLKGAAWRLLETIEGGRIVSVWTGPALADITDAQRKNLERNFMLCYRTIDDRGEPEHPYRWNEYRLR